jgi:hypothetical protein
MKAKDNKEKILNRDISGTIKPRLIFQRKKQSNLLRTFPIHILEDPELWPQGSQSPQTGQK